LTFDSGPKRICIVGGESTGKSTLAERLAEHYGTVYVPEFARPWLTPRGGKYTIAEAIIIARGQVEAEDRLAPQANRVLFCDTDPLTTTIWSELFFGDVDPAVRELADARRYDLYIVTAPDLPWEHDGLRHSPDSREWFDRRLMELLRARPEPHVRVHGPIAERLATATRAVDALLAGELAPRDAR